LEPGTAASDCASLLMVAALLSCVRTISILINATKHT
jgi:hypothetical protein